MDESDMNLPESGLGITRNTASSAFNTTLLSERSWRAALLTRLLLHGLLRRHTLGRTLLLIHAVVAIVLLELALLLIWVVLERHFCGTADNARVP
jgi:hypothetical protein